MQPESGFLGRVELRQPVDDVAQLGDLDLGLEVRVRLAVEPARNGRRGYGDNVGDVTC
jgi:hypothetical protein